MYIELSRASLVAQAAKATEYGLALPVFWAGFVMFSLLVGCFTANRLARRLSRRISLAALFPIGLAKVAGHNHTMAGSR